MKPPWYQTFVIPVNLASTTLPTEIPSVGMVALLPARPAGPVAAPHNIVTGRCRLPAQLR